MVIVTVRVETPILFVLAPDRAMGAPLGARSRTMTEYLRGATNDGEAFVLGPETDRFGV